MYKVWIMLAYGASETTVIETLRGLGYPETEIWLALDAAKEYLGWD